MEIEELYQAIGKLEGSTTEGFKAINKRLDIMNGSNVRRDHDINDLQKSRDIIAGKFAIINVICGFIGAAILAFFKFFKQ
jgi:hypothetical protein